MDKVLQATYRNGNLILDEKLDTALEGKKLKIIVLTEAAEPQNKTEAALEARKRRFLEHLDQYSFKLPEDYKFSREELYER